MCGRYVSPEEAEIERFWRIGQATAQCSKRFSPTATSMESN
jgi:hypothetical protein